MNNRIKILPTISLLIFSLLFTTLLFAEEAAREQVRNDSNIEQEVRKVWDAYYDAFARKDADAAADLLRSGRDNDEIRQEFRKNREKLPKIRKDGAVLKLVNVYDENYVKCLALRDEIVKGEKKTV